MDKFSEDVQKTTNNIASNYDSSSRRSHLLEEEKALLEAQITALEEGKALRKISCFSYISQNGRLQTLVRVIRKFRENRHSTLFQGQSFKLKFIHF